VRVDDGFCSTAFARLKACPRLSAVNAAPVPEAVDAAAALDAMALSAAPSAMLPAATLSDLVAAPLPGPLHRFAVAATAASKLPRMRPSSARSSEARVSAQ